VRELETAEVGELDEHRKAIRVRWTHEKNEPYRHLDLPDDLFAALLAILHPARTVTCKRRSSATDARLRMAITRACKAPGTSHLSPRGLRRRRGFLHDKRTGSLAQVAELVGDSKRVAADHYVYALTDCREVDRQVALARVEVSTPRAVLDRESSRAENQDVPTRRSVWLASSCSPSGLSRG
jgi:integrase